jgi:hypothetical protein
MSRREYEHSSSWNPYQAPPQIHAEAQFVEETWAAQKHKEQGGTRLTTN